jgi:hypothetical protein
MITPTLNANGTSADDLIDPRLKALGTLRLVTNTLAQVTPHGRDYPGDHFACMTDRISHYDRIATLNRIAAELMSEVAAIKKQTKGD